MAEPTLNGAASRTTATPGRIPPSAAEGGMLDRAGEIFLEVRDLGPLARDEAVDRACQENPELRKLVQLLIRGDLAPLPIESLAEDIRDACDVHVTASTDLIRARAATQGNDRIGNYRILERLGEGGFGVVYLAQQESPVRRRVALKIIKLGMDTRQVVARFEAERQALALMDHPNIAKVFDGGATETGRPYFVMELVRGLPITEYCDRNKLPIRLRLELIAEVCDALQHAHQKGIIHRDIKPSNVLVKSMQGSRPPTSGAGSRADSSISASPDPFRVKIIDFGIAKATNARLTEKTVFTEFRQMIGTPEYMSPEQAGESNEDIDTRTDVYSVGVLFYELLTGSTPFDSKRLRSAAYGEMQRIIREEPPPRPSTKLTTFGNRIDAIASQRATQPGKLTSAIRGELDWIVMKSLEKDRARRYDSAGAMAADIRRYLSGHAVLAAPASQSYRARTFIRRHKRPVLAGALVSLTLVTGLVGTSLGFYNATVERGRADAKALEALDETRRTAAERERADEQRDRAVAAERTAKLRADQLQDVAEFQENILKQIDFAEVGGLLAAEVAARFERALAEAAVPEEGGERARRVEAFSSDWKRVNTTDVARELIERTILAPAVHAVELRFADQPLVGAQLRQTLSNIYHALGMLDQAMRLQDQALTTYTALLGERHQSTLVAAMNKAQIHASGGHFDDAERLFRSTLATMRTELGSEHEQTLKATTALGATLVFRGKLDEAEPYFREAVARCPHALGPDHPESIVAINSLGILLFDQGKTKEAEPLLREAVERGRRVSGDLDRDTLTAICNLGLLLKNDGRLAEAEPLLREALEKRRQVLGQDHADTLTAINNLGTLLLAMGKTDDAERYLREGLDTCRRTLGDDHTQTLTAINNMGAVLKDQNRLAEAEPYYREAVQKQRRVLGADHPNTLASLHNLGVLLTDLGKYREAESCLEEAVSRRRSVLGETHPRTLISVIGLGSLRVAQGQHQAAIDLLAPIEEPSRLAFTGDNARRLATLLLNLGRSRTHVGGPDALAAAEPNLLEAHAIAARTQGSSLKLTRECAQALVDLYSARHAAEPEKGYDAKSRAWQTTLDSLPPAAPRR